MTPEEGLMCSLSRLRELVGALTEETPSTSAELLQLDRLIRKYPAAAALGLRLAQRIPADLPAPPGWSAAASLNGILLWQWHGGTPYVATADLDQLHFLGVSLSRFDRMTAEQLRAYVEE
ncbi:hypothetical protein [Actinoallomurus rhizosphaericola]|uniref:hypothetical protein n=1 Tax=Actinoallomurus rhizosphaericola TaxID=2952536 RepID=UPI0020935B8C|nr:hypothetical protein [Actinoallomurus rhizosphaericola]MCO5998236.1 hypothetical protein [Actinoallomurus rhizosphaericola]